MLNETFSVIFKHSVHFKSLGSCIDVKWNCCQITFRPSITQQGSYLSCLIKGAKKVYLCLGSFSPTPLEVTQTITRKIGNFCFPSFETPMKGNSGTNLECRDDKQTQTDSQVSRTSYFIVHVSPHLALYPVLNDATYDLYQSYFKIGMFNVQSIRMTWFVLVVNCKNHH